MSGIKLPVWPIIAGAYAAYRYLKNRRINRQLRQNEKAIEDLRHKHQATERELRQAQQQIAETKKELAEHSRILHEHSQKLDKLFSIQEKNEAAARHFLELIIQQQRNLEKLEFARLFREDYANLAGQIQNIQHNIQNGHFEAAIALAQNWHTFNKSRLSHYEESYLTAKALEYDLQDLHQALRQFQQSPTQKQLFPMEDGTKAELEYDQSFWAAEEWNQYTKAFQQFHANFSKMNQMNLAELENLESEGEYALSLANKAGEKALIRFQNYHHIAAMQEKIAHKLYELGFNVVENLYENDDERRVNVLLLENERSEKIKIEIEQDDENPKIKVYFNTLNPLTHAERFQAILQSIGTSNYKEEAGYEHRAAEAAHFDLQKYQAGQA
jgi:hypothetical protein